MECTQFDDHRYNGIMLISPFPAVARCAFSGEFSRESVPAALCTLGDNMFLPFKMLSETEAYRVLEYRSNLLPSIGSCNITC